MSEFAITNILQNCQDPYTRGFQVISHVEVVSFRANWHECAPRKGLRVAD